MFAGPRRDEILVGRVGGSMMVETMKTKIGESVYIQGSRVEATTEPTESHARNFTMNSNTRPIYL
jgi:hypothetical protein